MLRDNLKNADYFERYIANQQKRIEKFMEVEKSLPAADNEKKKQCNGYLANYYKDLLTALYSAGADKEEVAEIFQSYLGCVRKCGITTYADMIDLLALAILFQEKYETIKDLMVPAYKDALAGFLESDIKGVSDKLDGTLLFEGYFRPFYQYAVGEMNIEEFLLYMTEVWYGTNSDMSWYDAHKSKQDVYVGYWSWLAAALIKVKGDIAKDAAYIPVALI